MVQAPASLTVSSGAGLGRLASALGLGERPVLFVYA